MLEEIAWRDSLRDLTIFGLEDVLSVFQLLLQHLLVAEAL